MNKTIDEIREAKEQLQYEINDIISSKIEQFEEQYNVSVSSGYYDRKRLNLYSDDNNNPIMTSISNKFTLDINYEEKP